jgi:hypothetical protein
MSCNHRGNGSVLAQRNNPPHPTPPGGHSKLVDCCIRHCYASLIDQKKKKNHRVANTGY